jgi:O-antigen ligase
MPRQVANFNFKSGDSLKWVLLLGPIGVCSYIVGFTLPLKWDIPLMILAVTSIPVSIYGYRKSLFAKNTIITFSLLAFLVSTILSIIMSDDVGRSMRLSVALLPSILLFLLISCHHNNLRYMLSLYFAFTLVGLGLALMLILTSWRNPELGPVGWIAIMPSPILVVPNDITFLAIVAPFSLSLLHLTKHRSIRGLSILFIFLTLCVVCIYHSRIATLTAIVSLTTASLILWSHKDSARFSIFLILIPMVVILGCLGFPLAAKFGNGWDPRIAAWLIALLMFLDAPLLGHGPHTFALFYLPYLNSLDLPACLTVDTRIFPWAHNLYLEILAEQGIIGLATLIILLASGLTISWKARLSEIRENRVLAAGAFAALAGLCTAAVFEISLLRQWVVVVLFSTLGTISQLSSSGTVT